MQFDWEKWVPYGATLACFLIPVRCAFAFFDTNSRLFWAAAMYGLSFAVLLPYYSSNISGEMLPAFNGFLLAYVGMLLSEEAHGRQGLPNKVDPRAKLALGLLLIVVIPKLFALGTHLDWFKLPFKPTEYDAELLVNLVLTALGFTWLYDGLAKFAGSVATPISRTYLHVLGLVLFGYLSLSVCFALSQWSNSSMDVPMTATFKYAYAVTKVALTGVVLQILVWTEVPAAGRNHAGAWEKLANLLRKSSKS